MAPRTLMQEHHDHMSTFSSEMTFTVSCQFVLPGYIHRYPMFSNPYPGTQEVKLADDSLCL